MVIEINKDIDKYKETVALGLTARQLIFSVASVIVGGTEILLLYKPLGLTGAAYIAMPTVAPIALGGFYSFNGMDFYEYMGRKLHFMFANRALTYVSEEGDRAIEKLKMLNMNEEKLAEKKNKHLMKGKGKKKKDSRMSLDKKKNIRAEDSKEDDTDGDVF